MHIINYTYYIDCTDYIDFTDTTADYTTMMILPDLHSQGTKANLYFYINIMDRSRSTGPIYKSINFVLRNCRPADY